MGFKWSRLPENYCLYLRFNSKWAGNRSALLVGKLLVRSHSLPLATVPPALCSVLPEPVHLLLGARFSARASSFCCLWGCTWCCSHSGAAPSGAAGPWNFCNTAKCKGQKLNLTFLNFREKLLLYRNAIFNIFHTSLYHIPQSSANANFAFLFILFVKQNCFQTDINRDLLL